MDKDLRTIVYAVQSDFLRKFANMLIPILVRYRKSKVIEY